MQTAAEALAEDAAVYAAGAGVSLVDAVRRLRAQEETVATTDALAREFADRLAGIAIEHRPDYRIVVLLTGEEPVSERVVSAGGLDVPIVFRTGAAATRAALVEALERHQADIAAMFLRPPGMGVDPWTGVLAVIPRTADVSPDAVPALEARLSELAGVPVRVGAGNRAAADFTVEGGARFEGVDPANGLRFACTTGFVVTDGTRTGVVTAAHCPDTLTRTGPSAPPLAFAGQWGRGHQDVQVHVSDMILDPLFYADTARSVARPVTGWRNRGSTRAGDVVCHRGERTGYSCALVELVDFAPAGDLCAGPCAPSWVAVRGPACRAGDSGGPVFAGTVAFGILKGGSYAPDGRCDFYFYMSTDYLPDGWSLLHSGSGAERVLQETAERRP